MISHAVIRPFLCSSVIGFTLSQRIHLDHQPNSEALLCPSKKKSGRKRAPARHWSGLGGGRGTTARTDWLRNRLKRRAPLDAGQLRARDVNKITIIFPKKPFDLIPDRFYFFPLFFWKCISNHIVTALVQFCFSNKRHVSPWLAEASTSHRFRLFTIFIFLTHFHLRTALLAS